VIDVPDVKSIRAKTGLSQSKFAHKFGLGLRSVQNWEAQRCHPIGPASILLKIIDSNPLAVTSVLEG
jgi:putative transcriptional regulator